MGKYIPGNPNFLVQNMPGAGSMIAANHIYNMTKPDGLTLGTFGGALIMAQITGRKEVQFDWSKFGWIGTPYRAGHLLFMRSDAPVKTLDQLRQTNDPPRCSATGVGSTGYDIPRLLEDAFGFKFKVISGYPGGADQDLAMERNEVQCRAITIDGFFAPRAVHHLVQERLRAHLAANRKAAPSQSRRRADDFRIDGSIQDRRYQAPFGAYLLGLVGLWLDADRHHAGITRRASERCCATLGPKFSPIRNFKRTLAKRNWEARPVFGEELQNLAKEVVNQPPEVAAALKRILESIIVRLGKIKFCG